jgi:hypothetical protein
MDLWVFDLTWLKIADLGQGAGTDLGFRRVDGGNLRTKLDL